MSSPVDFDSSQGSLPQSPTAAQPKSNKSTTGGAASSSAGDRSKSGSKDRASEDEEGGSIKAKSLGSTQQLDEDRMGEEGAASANPEEGKDTNNGEPAAAANDEENGGEEEEGAAEEGEEEEPGMAASRTSGLNHSPTPPPVETPPNPYLPLEIHEMKSSPGSLFGHLTEIEPICQQAKETTPAGELLVNAYREFSHYRDRLRQLKANLEERGQAELNLRATETEDLKMLFAKEITDLERVLTQQACAAVPRTIVKRTEGAVFKSKAGVEETVDKVIAFWKKKHADLMVTYEHSSALVDSFRAKIIDYEHLQPDEFRTQRIVGLLREKAALEAQRGNGYRELIAELKADGLGREEKKEAAPVPLSSIDRALVEQELEAARRVSQAVDRRVSALKHALHVRENRARQLGQRMTSLAERRAAAPKASLDATLEEALNLRTAVAELNGDYDAIAQELAQTRAQHVTQESSVEEKTASHQDAYSAEMAAYKRQMRERKVRAIRAIHNSGGDVESRFRHLRAQQGVSVVSRQIATADQERVQLKYHLSNLSTQLRTSAAFLETTKGPN